MDNLEALNQTELLELISKGGGYRIKRAVPRERLIQLIRSGEAPLQEELAGTNNSRHKLQTWIGQNWSSVSSQLPCSGETKGKCTIHPCSEGRHLACWIGAKEYIL